MERPFQMCLLNLLGVGSVSLNYAVRANKPPGWNPVLDNIDDAKRLRYQVSLAGAEFKVDNKDVWQQLKLISLNTDMYDWIRQHDHTQNRRTGFQALKDLCQGK